MFMFQLVKVLVSLEQVEFVREGRQGKLREGRADGLRRERGEGGVVVGEERGEALDEGFLVVFCLRRGWMGEVEHPGCVEENQVTAKGSKRGWV